MKLPSGFEKADGRVIRRLIVSVQGRPKRGKTAFALTAPGPIALFDTDMGLEGVIGRFVGQKDIFLMDVSLSSDQEVSKKELDRVVDAWKDLLASPSIKTIVADTATDLWELARMGTFGKLEGVKSRWYGPINAEFRRLYRASLKGDKNVILIHKVKSLYVNDIRTKDFELAGFPETGSWAQVICEMARPGDDEDYPDDFRLKILDSRHNPELNGRVLAGPMCTFPQLAAMVLPDTKPSQWE